MKASLKLTLKCLLVISLMLVAGGLYAAEFQNITVNNGLSNRRVFCSAKDSKGFVWFATRVGIDKYDGEVFSHYDFTKYNDNFKIRGVISDRKGQIYAYTERFIYVYNENSDSFVQLQKQNTNKQEIITSELITSVFFDKDNCIWIGTTAGILYSKDLNTWSSVTGFNSYAVYCFADGVDGDFWLGTSKGVSYIYRSAQNQYHCKQFNPITYLANKRVQSLYFDRTSKMLWIGTFADGLFLYTAENQLKNILVSTSPIRTMSKLSSSEIWIGTDGGGIFVFDLLNGVLKNKYSQTTNNDGNFESNSIYHLLIDNGKVWISTYSAGVLLCNVNTISNKIFKHQKDNNTSLYNNHVNAIIEDKSQNIWFGTNSGISKYNPADNTWKHLLNDKNRNESVVILTLYEDENYIWAGGYAADLFCINKTTGAVNSTILPHSKTNNSKKNYIYSIAKDNSGNLWLGGNLDELTRYNPITKAVKLYPVMGIHKICMLNNDILLAATIRGIYSINTKTEKITYNDFSKVKYRGKFLNPFINSIYVDTETPNTVWLGSEGDGMYCYNLQTHKLRIFSTAQGFSSNYIYGIMNDGFGRLWISTENGLNCYNPKTNDNQSYFELDGLPDNTFNFLAYAKCKNGNMVWGTPKGAVEIVPEDIRKMNQPINLRFTSFNLFYQRVNAETENSPLTQSIDDTNELTLKYSQSSFSFDFIDLNYSSYPQIMYSWKLDGFDENWSIPTKDHKAVYTNIPPGTYTFMVKAYKLGNMKESITRNIVIVIHRPFWLSTIAYIIYLILLVLLARFLNNFWRNRIEAQNSDEKVRFFVNMAHDIRTPISLVKAPLNEIEHESLSDDGRSALAMAQRNLEKLFNMVTQLLDFQKIERDSMKLMVEKTLINGFVKSVANNFTMLALEKNIDMKVILPLEDMEVWIDRKTVSMCIENLLSNAIKYSKLNGNIQVTLSIVENILQIEVSDDGIGIPLKDQKNLFERFYRAENASNSKETGSGIGLMLTKRLVNLHKGKISFVSEEKLGTIFKFEIPCWKQDFKPHEIIQKEERVDSIENESDDGLAKKGVKIMLVEDNDEMRDYLSKQLRREYDVVEVSNGTEALEIIKIDAPDFILSDIMMPGISGFELCSILKKRIETCHIPIILLSSLSERNDIITGFNSGADDYITKPFDLDILETKIKSILKNRILFKKKYIAKTASKEDFASINELDKVFMERVIKFIEDNLTNEKFTIDNLALEMAMSRSVFYKKLKSLTDENPKDLVKEIKMRKASEFLRENKYPINEIAFLTGFPNSKYFSTAFKKFYGVSPSRFVNGGGDDIELDEEE